MENDSPRLDTLDRNDLVKEAFELAREQGVTDQATWNELVDELVQSHLDIGELNADQDLEGVKALLREGWNEYKREAGQETDAASAEDPEAPRG